jgi:3',5'-cyclic AMP phosphodiesterase CpdA
MKKFLTFISFVFCFLLSVSGAYANNIKFVQITDTHVSAQSDFSQKVLEYAIKDINSQTGISFVVFTGDNIASPSPENLRAFNSIIKKLKVPYYIVIGNHDVYKQKQMSKEQYFEILREGKPFMHQRSANYKFHKNGFIFLTVDGAKEVIPGSIGYYREGTLGWLDKTLSKNKKKSVVIFQHFPVEYPKEAENKLKTHRTYKIEEYQQILSNHHNVLAILSGHFHINDEIMKDGVYHISTPALLNVPYSYKIIDIVTTKDFSPIIYTQLREFEVPEVN